VLGLECSLRIDTLAIFELGGGPTLIQEVFDPDQEADEAGPLIARFTGVTLSVGDIAAIHSELTSRGVTFLGSPEKMPWGGTLAHFRDPAGNTLTLVRLKKMARLPWATGPVGGWWGRPTRRRRESAGPMEQVPLTRPGAAPN
jgi:hypothetical protein